MKLSLIKSYTSVTPVNNEDRYCYICDIGVAKEKFRFGEDSVYLCDGCISKANVDRENRLITFPIMENDEFTCVDCFFCGKADAESDYLLESGKEIGVCSECWQGMNMEEASR